MVGLSTLFSSGARLFHNSVCYARIFIGSATVYIRLPLIVSELTGFSSARLRSALLAVSLLKAGKTTGLAKKRPTCAPRGTCPASGPGPHGAAVPVQADSTQPPPWIGDASNNCEHRI